MTLVEKYRPRELGDILGQPWIVSQLEAFVDSPVSTAFLFEGATGTGKTSAAMVLARALGVAVEADELGGLWQIASGEQTGDTVRRAIDNLRVRPWSGSGWKVLIVNEADAMTPNAAYVWLDVLENLPSQTVVIFTTNSAAKIPARLRDRCERFAFTAGGLMMRPALQELVNKVWLAETGRTDAPDIDDLGELADENGDMSFRRCLQRLQPLIRVGGNVKVQPAVAAPVVVCVEGFNIRQEREKLNCPADRFATLARCGVSTLYAIERGKRKPAGTLALRINQALELIRKGKA